MKTGKTKVASFIIPDNAFVTMHDLDNISVSIKGKDGEIMEYHAGSLGEVRELLDIHCGG
ncbi:unnamed protein product [marine sediment metagenome]|uniref:Uncharacterized protein n=1 Tax=marine sediment metagenome TaxID=412755 RepID=X0XER7_9ZZZZ